jgi:arginyl-tRNA--protein-N-Asp/Glu arginylyltransferase
LSLSGSERTTYRVRTKLAAKDKAELVSASVCGLLSGAKMKELEFLRVISDETDVCPYLPDRTSRLPLCLSLTQVTGRHLDLLLESGYRRSGAFFYRPRCPQCEACEAIRIATGSGKDKASNKPVDAQGIRPEAIEAIPVFRPSRTHRRALRRGEQALRFEINLPTVDRQRVKLFNLHRRERGLSREEVDITNSEYRSFLLNAPCDSLELSIWYQEQLVAVSISDVGTRSLSAVYTYFDPAYSEYGLGTLAVLKQWELGRQAGRQWLYLGLYVEANRHLNYKARFRPHQRRVRGEWRSFH